MNKYKNSFINLNKEPPCESEVLLIRKKICKYMLFCTFSFLLIVIAYAAFIAIYMKQINIFFHNSHASEIITTCFVLFMCIFSYRFEKIEIKKAHEFGFNSNNCDLHVSDAELYFIESKRKDFDLINSYCKKVNVMGRSYFVEEFLKIKEFCDNKV